MLLGQQGYDNAVRDKKLKESRFRIETLDSIFPGVHGKTEWICRVFQIIPSSLSNAVTALFMVATSLSSMRKEPP